MRKPASVRRQDLIEAGLRVIAREGIHGATVRAIVAEAGVPLATFHYVFASRDEMIGEAYGYIAIQPSTGVALPEGATLEDAVRVTFHRWFDAFLEHPEYELAIMEIMAYCRRTPALAHLPAAVQERYVEGVSELVEHVREQLGVTDPAMPTSEVASLVLHVTDGITYAWLRTNDSDASRRSIEAAAPMLAAAIGEQR
ncbi:TetR/AcrR family transcriptional regulator [Agrococcus sp. HG114]|uniref:TetR/AcrR family transcriptional regulator n=1 Tax=Agrococcus sp. HG114 TaxID=2969757 RepID=UPI00215ABF63|nr:TetR family transcriptional regulator [Agrococcus sp. HG114]MCR8669832.1 TetR family transcriptional regulator [Agrococcus sp. HG114]